MTTGNESDPRDDALAKAWRAQSQDLPPPALDATILAAAHRAAGSGPRDTGKQAMEATRPQRWWMPLAAAATIGVVAIGILQIAPQAPVDIVVGERAEVAGRVAPAVPTAPAKDAAQGSVVATLKDAAPPKNVGQANAVAPTTQAPSIPAPSIPAPEPFPADKLSSKVDAQSTTRQNERKDAAKAERTPAPYNEAATRSEAKAPPASARPAAPVPAPMGAPAPLVAQTPATPAAPATAMMAPAAAPPAAPAPAMTARRD